MLVSGRKKTPQGLCFFTEINFRCKAVSLLPIRTVSDCYHVSFVLCSVQPQLPSSGESSYSINVSCGHVSIGNNSVINVGIATPR